MITPLVQIFTLHHAWQVDIFSCRNFVFCCYSICKFLLWVLDCRVPIGGDIVVILYAYIRGCIDLFFCVVMLSLDSSAGWEALFVRAKRLNLFFSFWECSFSEGRYVRRVICRCYMVLVVLVLYHFLATLADSCSSLLLPSLTRDSPASTRTSPHQHHSVHRHINTYKPLHTTATK